MGTGSGVSAHICRPSELGPGEIAAWHGFQAARLELQHPFLSPEFALAVDAARPDARVAVLEHDGELCGFLPHRAGRWGLAGPIAPAMTDRQGVVADPAWAFTLPEALAGTGLAALEADHLLAEQAPGDPGEPTWVIDLEGGWEGYRAWAKAERRRYLRWLDARHRRFFEEHPTATFTWGRATPESLAALRALKSAQCQRRGWDDFLARPWVVEMIERLAATETTWLAGRMATLEVDGRVVAADFSLASTSVYAGWLIAYDDALAHLSPGSVRWRLVLEAAAAAGIGQVDLGKGADDFKRRFATGTAPLAEGLWVARGGYRGLALRARRALRSARATAERSRSARAAVRAGRRLRFRAQAPLTDPKTDEEIVGLRANSSGKS